MSSIAFDDDLSAIVGLPDGLAGEVAAPAPSASQGPAPKGLGGLVPLPEDSAQADAKPEPDDTSATAPAGPQDRKGPGRPRSARLAEAIIGAVIALLSEGTTAEALSIEAVAARAGVGKATIYRRWINKDALLVDAVASLKGPLPEIAGASVQDDIITLLRPVGRNAAVQASSVLPCLIPELKRSPTLHRCYQKVIEPRRELMRSVLRRGIATGELRDDLDLEVVIAMLAGPMLAQSVLDWDPRLDRETLPERLVDAIWPAIAAKEAATSDAMRG